MLCKSCPSNTICRTADTFFGPSDATTTASVDVVVGRPKKAAEDVGRQDSQFCSIHGHARVYTSVNAAAGTRSTRGRFASTSHVKMRRKDLRKYLDCGRRLSTPLQCYPPSKKKSRWRVDRQTHPPHHASAPALPRCNVSQPLDLCACRRALMLGHLMSSYCGYAQAVWPQQPPSASGTACSLSGLHGQHNREVRALLILPSEERRQWFRPVFGSRTMVQYQTTRTPQPQGIFLRACCMIARVPVISESLRAACNTATSVRGLLVDASTQVHT